MTETKILNDPAVSIDVRPLEVIQESATLAHHLEQSSPAVMIFGVLLEVVGEVVDTLSEDCDLHPARTSVSFVTTVFSDRRCLLKSHVVYSPHNSVCAPNSLKHSNLSVAEHTVKADG